MPATALRRQLSDVNARKGDLRDRLASARADRDQTRQQFADSNDAPSADSPLFRAAERAAALVRDLEQQLALAQDEEAYLLGHAAGVDGAGVYGGRQSFLHDPSTLSTLAQVATSSAPIGRMMLGPWADREQVSGMTGRAVTLAPGEVTPTDRSRDSAFRGIAPQLQPPLSFLDLLPTEPMDGRSVPYAREVGSIGGGAAVVPEGAVKPAATIDYEDAEAKAATIAHHTKVRKQQLADIAALAMTLRGRLMYGVLRALEAQVIAGDGVGDNLRGIINTTGVGSIAYDAAALAADQALEGLVAVMLAGAQPNVVALHPRDWANMLKVKAAGSGDYYSAGPFVATAQTLWGAAAVPALGVPQGRALVGDTRLGATLLVREGVNVLVSDSDQDDFTRNRVTLLAEGRWALATWQPSAWCVVNLTA